MKTLCLLKRLFFEGTWACAYRKLDQDDKNQITTDKTKNVYKIIPVNKEYWCADPFIVENNGRVYIFCEMFDRKKKKGMLGFCEVIDDAVSEVKLIKELDCHASYPCVFTYKGEYYMIPETGKNQTVELYRAESFPEKWTLDKVLINECDAADTTVYMENGEIFLFIYNPGSSVKNRSLNIGKLNMETKQIEDVKQAATYEDKIGRPAGNILKMAEKLIRPTQYCVNMYGEKIIYKEISGVNCSRYVEKDVGYLTINSIEIDRNYKIRCVHTINRCGGYEVIDVFYRKFSPLRILEGILKKLKIGGYQSNEKYKVVL